jgi:hypothetical protein
MLKLDSFKYAPSDLELSKMTLRDLHLQALVSRYICYQHQFLTRGFGDISSDGQTQQRQYRRQYILPQTTCVAQWLERRCKDLVFLASPVKILLWDVAFLRMRPYKPRSHVAVGVARKRTLTAKAMSAKHRSKFAALSSVNVTAAG